MEIVLSDIYTTEEEQVEKIKRWWKEHGTSLVLGLVLGIGGLSGYRYWDHAQNTKARSASVNYEHFLSQISENKLDDARATGRGIVDGYPGSIYADLTALLLARLAVDSGDLSSAEEVLNALVDSKTDGEIAIFARARLARLYLAQGQQDQAQASLDMIPELEGKERFSELRGDVAAAQGEVERARTYYLEALAQAKELRVEQGPIQLKLDNLTSLVVANNP